jgi:Zn-dependent M28 family amino/carboxypeptidase
MVSLLTGLLVSSAPFRPIDARELRAHTRFLASDLLEGRGPASRGDALAQAYIAAQFEVLGLEPAAPDGGFVQPVEMVGITGHPEVLEARVGSTVVPFAFRDDFIAVSGHQREQSRLERAELVFVGYGIQAPEFRWDDFKGVDVTGKVLVVMNNDPEDDPRLFGGKARLWYGRWDYKYEQARRLGAAGCLIIHTTPSAGYPWQVVQTSWSGEQFELPATDGHALELKGWLTEAATRRLFALTGKNLDTLRASAATRKFKPVPLGVTLSASFSNVVARKTTGNVLAMLRGSDPSLRDQVVVLTAHHDHLGVKPGAAPGEDAIYNGAVDNAGGVAGLLAVARALASLPKPPRRSVLFAAVAAEEQGLLGSQWLVENPPVPPSRMAACLNLDGINIWGRTRDVSVIGLGKSSLDAVLGELAKQQGRVVKPDALVDRGFFYRSDQFNFAKVGVPSTYFSSGHDFIGRPEGWGRQQRERWEATHYHQPSDEMTDGWDWSGAVEDVQLYFELARAVADADAMPVWTSGDEFEAVRRKSLAR